MLQQLSEQDGSSILEYRVISESGPEHDKEYTVAAFINDNEVGRGAAKNKKDAEMGAARAALLLFGYLL
jgi:ribonuclease-3